MMYALRNIIATILLCLIYSAANAANNPSLVPVVPSITTLKTLPAAQYPSIITSSYYSNKNIGSGLYIGSTSSCGTPDNIICFQSNTSGYYQRILPLNWGSADVGCPTFVFPTTTNCQTVLNSAFTLFSNATSGTDSKGITLNLPQLNVETTTVTLLTNDQIRGQQCGGLSDFLSSNSANSLVLFGGGTTSGTYAFDSNQVTPIYGAGISCTTIIPVSISGSHGVRLNSVHGSIDNDSIQFIGEDAVNLQGNSSRVEFDHLAGLADYSIGTQPSVATGVLELASADNYIRDNEITCLAGGLTGSNLFAQGLYDQSGNSFVSNTVTEFCDVDIHANGLGTIWQGDRADAAYGIGVLVDANSQVFSDVGAGECSVGATGTYPCWNVTGNSEKFYGIRAYGVNFTTGADASFAFQDLTTWNGYQRNFLDAGSVISLTSPTGQKFNVATSGGILIQTPHGDPAETFSCASPIALDDPSHLNDVGDVNISDSSPHTCSFTGGFPGMDLRITMANGNDTFQGVIGPGTFDFVDRAGTWVLIGNGTVGVQCSANTVSLTSLVVRNGVVTHC